MPPGPGFPSQLPAGKVNTRPGSTAPEEPEYFVGVEPLVPDLFRCQSSAPERWQSCRKEETPCHPPRPKSMCKVIFCVTEAPAQAECKAVPFSRNGQPASTRLNAVLPSSLFIKSGFLIDLKGGTFIPNLRLCFFALSQSH